MIQVVAFWRLCACVYIYIYAYIHIGMCIYIHIHTRLHACTDTHIQIQDVQMDIQIDMTRLMEPGMSLADAAHGQDGRGGSSGSRQAEAGAEEGAPKEGP